MSEKDLQKKIELYGELAKENPNVDAGLLMMSALQNEDSRLSQSKSRKWAYIISMSLPPFGLLFALKYYFGEDEDRQAAFICVLLTVVSVIAFFIFSKILFSSSGADLGQIQQINPADIRQLSQ